MRHKNGRFGLAALTLSLVITSGCASGVAMQAGSVGTMDRAGVARMTAGWHTASREAVMYMTEKYGPPAELTATMAVWNRTGPWKRSIVYSSAVQHDFPMPHPDVFEQFIDYRMPPEMFDEIAMYDGSVIVERTKGEMSARCDKEGANFLAVNLANEIATGRMTVEAARQKYGEEVMKMKAGQMTPYTSGLMFTPPASGNDPDRPLR